MKGLQDGHTPLDIAALHGQPSAVKARLITGANIHAGYRKGLSAPHDTANYGQVETIES